MTLFIQTSNFIAGSRGWLVSYCTSQKEIHGNKDHGGALLTPCREELDLLDDVAVDVDAYQ